MDKFKNWIDTRPSQSRWGIFSTILSLSLSILVLGVSGLLEIITHIRWVVSLSLLLGGLIGIIASFGLAILFLARGPKDPTAKDIEEIRQKMVDMDKKLDGLTRQKKKQGQ